ncbi:hypothetical protein NC652_003843 [Populus alba x Populus x berolinensis]|nr:hypothetical protein NC652_003843 [Populus alba x Populus x berolinensis]
MDCSRDDAITNITWQHKPCMDVSDVADSVSPLNEHLLADDCSVEEDSTGELDGDLIFFNSPALSSVPETFTAYTVGVTPSSGVAVENPSTSTDGVSNSSGVRVQYIDPIAGAKDCSGTSQPSVLGLVIVVLETNLLLPYGLFAYGLLLMAGESCILYAGANVFALLTYCVIIYWLLDVCLLLKALLGLPLAAAIICRIVCGLIGIGGLF